jgi:hypothetical protein
LGRERVFCLDDRSGLVVHLGIIIPGYKSGVKSSRLRNVHLEGWYNKYLLAMYVLVRVLVGNKWCVQRAMEDGGKEHLQRRGQGKEKVKYTKTKVVRMT